VFLGESDQGAARRAGQLKLTDQVKAGVHEVVRRKLAAGS